MAEHGDGHPLELAGFAVGVVERAEILTGAPVRPGDVLLGLPSAGLRSNGYSLARRVLLRRARPARRARRGRARRTRWPTSCSGRRSSTRRPWPRCGRPCPCTRFAHITGGGVPGNLDRVLPEGCRAVIERGSWPVPRIFAEVQAAGDVADDEMARVFNLGIGLVAVVPPEARAGGRAGAGRARRQPRHRHACVAGERRSPRA